MKSFKETLAEAIIKSVDNKSGMGFIALTPNRENGTFKLTTNKQEG